MRRSVGLVIVLVAGGLPPLRAAEAGASSDGGNALSAVVAKALPRVVKIYGTGPILRLSLTGPEAPRKP